MNRCLETIGSLLYPQDIRCLSCGDEQAMDRTSALCPNCREALAYAMPPLCVRCGRPFAKDHVENDVCNNCAHETPAYWQARAPFLYQGRLPGIIRGFKYRQQLYWARFVASEMAQVVREVGWKANAVLPVPLHWSRAWRRGYNQSLLLAKHIAVDLGIPLDSCSLRRVRATQHQVGLSGEKRRQNLDRAFVSLPMNGRSLLLVDDVLTTGTTAERCAQTLLQAGARRVWLVTAATQESKS